MCAHAVRVAMKKVQGVDDVHVSLEKAFTEIWLKPGNTVTLPQLREVIKRGGFTPGDAQIKASGKVIDHKGRLAVDILPAPQVLIVSGESSAASLAEAERVKGQAAPVEVMGAVNSMDVLILRSVTPAKR